MTHNELKSKLIANLASVATAVQQLRQLILTQPPLNSSDFPGHTYGTAAIARERARQIELWGTKNDEQYIDNELARAAVCYATPPERRIVNLAMGNALGNLPADWPSNWKADWWRPGSYERDLEKAGALIAAELDRRWALRPANTTDSGCRNAQPVTHANLNVDFNYAQVVHERDRLRQERDKARSDLLAVAKAVPMSLSNDMPLVDVILIGIGNLKQAAGLVDGADRTREVAASVLGKPGVLSDLSESLQQPAEPWPGDTEFITIEQMVEEVCHRAEQRLAELPTLTTMLDPDAATEVECVSRELVSVLLTQIENDFVAMLQESQPAEDVNELVDQVLADREQCLRSAVVAIDSAMEYVPPHRQQTDKGIVKALDVRNQIEHILDTGSGVIEQLLRAAVWALELPAATEDKPVEHKPTRYWKYMGTSGPGWQTNEAGDIVFAGGVAGIPTDRNGTPITVEWLESRSDVVQCNADGEAIQVKAPADLLQSATAVLCASAGVPVATQTAKATSELHDSRQTSKQPVTRYWRYAFNSKPDWQTDVDGQIIIPPHHRENGVGEFPRGTRGERLTVEYFNEQAIGGGIVECDKDGNKIQPNQIMTVGLSKAMAVDVPPWCEPYVQILGASVCRP